MQDERDVKAHNKSVQDDTFLWCEGKRYNFKKGFEVCLIRDSCFRCKIDKRNLDSNNTLQFKTIKEFRECPHYMRVQVIKKF